MGSRAQDPVEITCECSELLASVRLEKVFRIPPGPPGKNMLARSLLLLLPVCGLHCLDYGGHGVWDSPMATDYWVKRFGFMWAGGRSGMKGMEALQKTADLTYNNEIPTSIYNPSGIYGLKAMGSVVPEYPQIVTQRPVTNSRLALPLVKEKKMVKLAPLRMDPTHSFDRFMAVP